MPAPAERLLGERQSSLHWKSRANGDHGDPMLTPASLRTFVVAFAITALTLVAGCERPGICDDFDAMERTERFVIPEHRAVAIGLAADAGYGPPVRGRVWSQRDGRFATRALLQRWRCDGWWRRADVHLRERLSLS